MSLAADISKPASGSTRRRFGRKKFDPQPTDTATVLIAITGAAPVSTAVIRRAVAMSEGGPVALVSLARIYGSAMGLPNPGLMPSKRELAEHTAVVTRTVARLERAGVKAFGQIAATRRPVKTIVAVAQARAVRHVIVVSPEQPKWRRVVEGELAHDVGRRLPDDVTVERGVL
jgi:hypothetical protein